MKFGKEFASQMVPEWREAYLDYAYLKTFLNQIQDFKLRDKPAAPTLKSSHSLYHSFSGLTELVSQAELDIENQVILVNNVWRDRAEGLETTFLKTTDEGGEYELIYFKRLDDEFNKVLEFYRSKIHEVMEEAGELNKQMDAFLAFRVKVEHPNGWVVNSDEASWGLEDSAAALSATSQSVAIQASSRRVTRSMESIDKEHSITIRNLQEESDRTDLEDLTAKKLVNSQVGTCEEANSTRFKRPPPLEILNQVKFNAKIDTPRSTIKGILKLNKKTELKFTKDNLKKAEEQLKKAFVEFYHKLRLLKNYRFLNLTAISKIMKKYDKIASRDASRYYMKMVEKSSLGSSEEVSRLIERVEVTFIMHFANSNRSKGMRILRPRAKREKHRITFSMGFLVGCTISLISALILIIRTRDIQDEERTEVYMDTMFPLYSSFGFVILHMLTYGANIYYWRKYQVNYSFILGFKQGTELGYKEVFLLSFSISVLALASVLANLDMEMDPQTQDYQSLTELLPLGLVVLLISILLCPLNILFRSSRFFFLACLYRCVLAPLYKVTISDFLLADQLTSQVRALRSLEFYMCYYGWGDYKHRHNSCASNHVFKTFSYIIAAVPFWCRLMQCLRRMCEEKDINHGYNGIKYFMTLVAVCTRTAYTRNGARTWRIAALISSFLATVYSIYWDIVHDWGLLQRKAKNRWLRDKLLIPHKSVYFAAIVLDVLLRLAWIQTVMNITPFHLRRQIVLVIMAGLEIMRRGMWNFFRLENEHLNNVGKFRASNEVPLPFNYDDDENKDD